MFKKMDSRSEEYREPDEELGRERRAPTTLFVKLLHSDAKIPTKKNDSDAAYDISSIEDVVIEPGAMKIISTGLSFTAPRNSYGQIAPRSGLSMKGLFINAGVIDRGYTGEVKVVAFNFGNEALELPKRSRIAQVIFKKIYSPIVQVVDDLTNVGSRADSGFGSSGL